MSDDPFADFHKADDEARVDNPPKEKKKRKIPPKKTSAPPAPAADTSKPKKTRKPRAAKELRLPISTLLEIGHLSEEESGALISIGAGLQKLGKKSRGKIVAALSKIFG
jgi:hypothetical protein